MPANFFNKHMDKNGFCFHLMKELCYTFGYTSKKII